MQPRGVPAEPGDRRSSRARRPHRELLRRRTYGTEHGRRATASSTTLRVLTPEQSTMTARFALTAAPAAGLFVCACVSPGDLSAGEGGGAAAPGRKNPIPADGRSLAAGREVYTANCADCHGAGGKGDG